MKKFIIFVFILIVAIAAGLIYIRKPAVGLMPNQIDLTLSESNKVGNNTYRNEKYKFQFEYPSEFELEERSLSIEQEERSLSTARVLSIGLHKGFIQGIGLCDENDAASIYIEVIKLVGKPPFPYEPNAVFLGFTANELPIGHPYDDVCFQGRRIIWRRDNYEYVILLEANAPISKSVLSTYETIYETIKKSFLYLN